MPPHLTESITTGSAVGAASAPWWIHYAIDASPVLAVVAQLLGIIWLTTQIWHKWCK